MVVEVAFDDGIEAVEAMEVALACYHNSLVGAVAVVEVEVEQYSY